MVRLQTNAWCSTYKGYWAAEGVGSQGCVWGGGGGGGGAKGDYGEDEGHGQACEAPDCDKISKTSTIRCPILPNTWEATSL